MPRRMLPEDRRQAIVEATLAVARRQGLGATTVRDIATEMGTSSGLVHHYFDSMDEVLAAAFEHAAAEDLASVSAAVAAKETPADQLAAFIGTYAPARSDWSMQLWLDAWSEAARRPALQTVSRRLNVAWQTLLADIIESGVATGEFRSDDPGGAAWRILSVLDGLALQIVAHRELIGRDQLVDWASASAERELA